MVNRRVGASSRRRRRRRREAERGPSRDPFPHSRRCPIENVRWLEFRCGRDESVVHEAGLTIVSLKVHCNDVRSMNHDDEMSSAMSRASYSCMIETLNPTMHDPGPSDHCNVCMAFERKLTRCRQEMWGQEANSSDGMSSAHGSGGTRRPVGLGCMARSTREQIAFQLCFVHTRMQRFCHGGTATFGPVTHTCPFLGVVPFLPSSRHLRPERAARSKASDVGRPASPTPPCSRSSSPSSSSSLQPNQQSPKAPFFAARRLAATRMRTPRARSRFN